MKPFNQQASLEYSKRQVRLIKKKKNSYDPGSDMTLIFDTETLNMVNEHLLPKSNF